MSTLPDQRDYVRYALYCAGINVTDEIVDSLYATGYPYQAVDSLVALLSLPSAKEAMERMQRLTGIKQEQLTWPKTPPIG